MLHRNKKDNCITLMDDRGIEHNGEAVAETFNRYFVDVPVSLLQNLPPVGNTNFLNNITTIIPSCFMFPTTDLEVMSVLKSFPNKGNPIYDITPSVLSRVGLVISPILADYYNRCLSLGVYPSVLKSARVVPIHKSGSSRDVNNYRPISNLLALNKIFESLTLIRLKNFSNIHNIISNNQYGFRDGRSTTQAVFRLMCDLTTTFRFRLYTVVLFLDLRKAFDLVDHTILIKKLDLYGYRGVCNKFLKSYLSDRRQYVSVGSFSSDYVNLTHGVPQGSVLGPFLFNIFINDITLITKSKVILFADDAAFYITDDCFQSCMDKLNQLIEVLSEWLTFNRLVPNIGKTKLMLITTRIVPDLPIVLFNGIELEWVDSFKYLGTVIDRKLNFNCHVDQVCKSLSKMRGVIYAVSDLIPSNILLTLYKSLVLPLLINNIIIWGCTGVTNRNRLTISVHKILRLILKVKHNENNVTLMPVNEMYKYLKILKFIDFLLKFAYV